MALQLGYLAVLTVVASGLPVKDPLGPTQPKGHKLEYLAALWRHGERAPAGTFAHDLYNASDWENGYGELTSYGIEQQRRLGKWIYNRYVKEFGHLPDEFDPKSTRIQSTWYNRTRESALYNFKGLYGERIDYDQLNILTIPKNETDVIGLPYDGCGYAHELAVGALKTNEVVRFMRKHKEWISRLLKATNYGNLTYIVDLYCVEDPIYLEERKGLKLAPEYKKNFNNIFDIYVEEIKFMYGIDVKPQNGINWRYELVKMQAGGLLTRVANDMSAKAFCKVKPDQPYCKEDNVADLKYRVFSMHDTNVLGVLNSFDFPKVDYNRNDNVELGSSLFFELWNDEEKDRKYVKIIYRRSPEEIYDLSEQIRGCKSIGKGLGCSLDDFLRRTDKYLIPSSEKYCAQKLPQLGTFETIPQVHFKL